MTNKMDNESLKIQVHNYWNERPCGTAIAKSRKYSKEYFDEIEERRYSVEPEIFSFDQFARFRGCKVLEVGVGVGTDFIQWVRAGAQAYGLDLTEEGVEHVKERLEVYGLKAEEIRVADAENLPYPDNQFDLVYSWGVVHHTPNTIKALEEIIRVTRPGGRCKIMVYNRRSISVFYKYFLYGIMRGKLFKSISWILSHHQESIGTKAFTIGEVKSILSKYAVENVEIQAPVTKHDLFHSQSLLIRIPAYVLACLLGFYRAGWFMTIEFEKAIKMG